MTAPLVGSMREDSRDRDCRTSCLKGLLCEIKNELKATSACTRNVTPIYAEDIGTTGYVIDQPGDYCLAEEVVFNPGLPAGTAIIQISDPTGSGAQTLGLVSGGVLRGVNVLSGGSGYTNPTAIVTGAGSGASVTPLWSGIDFVEVTNPGSGYVAGETTASIVGTGTGAQIIPQVSGSGTIQGFEITDPGYGYTTATVVISAPTSLTQPPIQATATAHIASGQIVGFQVNSGGAGYTDTVQAAITIKSSNVNLNINYPLSQAGVDAQGNVSSTQWPYVVGVLVPEAPNVINNPDVNAIGYESIYIGGDQGIINGFSMQGISIFGHVADLQLSNLTVKNCGKLAALANRPFPAYQPINGDPRANIVIGLQPPVSFLVGGIRIGETNFLGLGPQFFTQRIDVPQNRVNSVVINNVSCLNNFFTGLLIANTTNTTIDNSHFDNTYCDDPQLYVVGAYLGPNVSDFEFPSLLNLVVRDSTFNNSSLQGDYTTQAANTFVALGAASGRSVNMTFERCQFNNTTSTFAGDLNVTTVVGMVNARIEDVSWIDCNFDGTTSLYAAEGVHISGHSYYSMDPIDHDTSIKSAKNIRFIRCTANNTTQNGQLQLPAPVSASSVSTGGLAIGYATFYVKNLYFEDCVAMNSVCNGPSVPAFGTAIGFFIGSGGDQEPAEFEADNTVLKGCVAARMTSVNGGAVCGIQLLNYADFIAPYTLKTIALEDCIVEGCQSLVPTYTQAPYNAVQDVAVGFFDLRIYGADSGYPVSYTNCKALHNKGVPSISGYAGLLGELYSAGFAVAGAPLTYAPEVPFPVERRSFYGCEAIDNVYGFLLNNCQYCVVRDCRSDFNVDNITGVTGEGFTDLGMAEFVISTSVNTTVVTPGLFDFAIWTGSATPDAYAGDYFFFTSGANAGLGGVITAYSGAPDYVISSLPVVPFFGLAEGDGVIILKPGSPLAPNQSTSLFQANSAFMNGPLSSNAHFGTNQNYNVWYSNGLGGLDNVPTLTGNLTNPGAVEGGYFFPQHATYAPVHNISITQS